MINYFKRNRINIIIVFIFLILPFIFFKDSIKLNSVILGMGDTEQVFLPYQYLKLNLLKYFELPFWNRYIFSGFPLFSSSCASILYPITLIFGLLLPVTISYNLSVLIHYSLAGIFLYLFLREYKLNRIACFTAGLIFMFSGSMITHRDHITMLYTIIWCPLILLLLEKYRKSKRVEFIFLSSIFYSFSFFGGAPQIFLYESIVILFFIIFYSFLYNGVQKYFIFSLSIFIFVFLLISIQLIPNYILIKNSIREVISYTFFSDFSFSPKLLPVLFFPYIFGSGSQVIQNVPKYFGPWNAGEMLIYFGISTIPLLIFGFFKKSRHKYLWIFILFFSFILVFGRYNPLYKIIYYIPLLNMARISTRHWFEFGLAFSILAGFGFDYFINLSAKKVKKIVISIIVFLSMVIISFFIFYEMVNTSFKNKLLGFFINNTNEVKYFLQNLKLTNYSIYVPLIMILTTIIIFIVAFYKKNKIIYILLTVLIFIDLFSFGHFLDENRENSYIFNKLEDSESLKILQNEEDIFRVFSLAYKTSGYKLYANQNIYYGIDIIDGYDPMMLEDYSNITGIKNDPGWGIDWIKLLKNNNIISMLNTKYIILPKTDDINKIMENARKVTYKNNRTVLNYRNYGDSEFFNSKFSLDNKEIILFGEQEKLKSYKIPILIEKNKDYLISFNISGNEELNNNIYFDFYGEGYDQNEQEFNLTPSDVEEDYKKITYIFNSGLIPKNVNVYFRIFTYSDGEYRIKDLEIYDVDVLEYNNYDVIYSDEDILIFENLNYIPRFYCVSNIQEVDNIEQVKNIMWEGDIIWEDNKFNPKDTALIENVDFSKRKFDNINNKINIIDYKNNNIILKVKLDSDVFMVFSDAYFPGWKSYIDGKETRIYKTNGILKGIYIPKGDHEVKFNYFPPYFLISSIISFSTFLLIAGGTITIFLRRKKRKKSFK